MDSQPLLLLSAASLLAWIVWTAFYRLFLHPLAKIPGPRLPALTTLYEMYYEVWQPGQYAFQVKKLHEKYGPVIRPVPDEVHINDTGYLDTIYALRGRNCPKQSGLMVQNSVGGAEEFALHKMRRDALNPYFSQKFVVSMEGVFVEKEEQVIKRFEEAAKTGEVLNLSDVYFAFANDVVRNFSFGSDSGLLEDLHEAKEQRNNLMRLLTGVKINKHFPWVAGVMGKFISKLLGEKAIPPAVTDLLKFKARAKKDVEAILADKLDEKKSGHSVFYELRDSTILPPEEKEVDRLMDEATLLVLAGTESGAKSLQYGCFYLLYYPATLEKLRRELHEATENAATRKLMLSDLLKLPYLNGVIMEANRLTYGVTNRMRRYAKTETLTYTATYGPHKGETYVFPPGTIMSCGTYCTHTNEELFPDPFTFDPERFIGQSDEVNRRKRCMMALGKGHRRCLGINVANAAMCLVLRSFAEYDMRLFETTYADVEFRHDYQIAHPRLDTLGIRVEVDGKRE